MEKEIANKTKKTAEYLTLVNGIRSSAVMDDSEKKLGKITRATNDLAKSPFSMVKETKRHFRTNMSINKYGDAALMSGNHYMDRKLTAKVTKFK